MRGANHGNYPLGHAWGDEMSKPAEIIAESLARAKESRKAALSAVHAALDNATMAHGMTEADIWHLSAMMKQIRVMKDHKS